MLGYGRPVGEQAAVIDLRANGMLGVVERRPIDMPFLTRAWFSNAQTRKPDAPHDTHPSGIRLVLHSPRAVELALALWTEKMCELRERKAPTVSV
jgi:hypothetical protein